MILRSHPIDAVNIKRTIRWIIIDVRDMEDSTQILIISLCDINPHARIFIIDPLNIKDTALGLISYVRDIKCYARGFIIAVCDVKYPA